MSDTFDDRRAHARFASQGQLTLCRDEKRTNADLAYCTVELGNQSEGGMSATCDQPLKQDEPVTILFPGHGNEIGAERHGHVVRCEADDQAHSYKIAIAYDIAEAA